MVELIAKAAPIYLIAFVIFALSYSAGYAAGSLKWVDYAAILESRVLRLARNLEYWIPGYGGLLKSYKEGSPPKKLLEIRRFAGPGSTTT